MTAFDPAGGDGPAPIVPLDGRPPHYIPVDGGGRCDRCGWRTFRHTTSGLWRHLDCETPTYHAFMAARRRQREPRDRKPPRRLGDSRKLCTGCCLCAGRAP